MLPIFLSKKEMSIDDIVNIYIEYYNTIYPIVSIKASFERVEVPYSILHNKNYLFLDKNTSEFIPNDFYKEKEKIFFINSEQTVSKTYYSFIDNRWHKDTSEIINIKNVISPLYGVRKPYEIIINDYQHDFCEIKNFKEWVFNPLFKHWHFNISGISVNIPKGFYTEWEKFLKTYYSADYGLKDVLLFSFIISQKTGISFKIIAELGLPEQECPSIATQSELFYTYIKKQYDILIKILTRELKRCLTIDSFYPRKILHDLFTNKNFFENNFQLDSNRTTVQNYDTIKNFLMEQQSQLLTKALSRYDCINNTIIDNKYIVKIPQTLVDLQNEGRQQNNCVGEFYNKAIINNEFLIYFIRKVESPDKSYITCRYNLKSNKTVEARIKNNRKANIESDIFAKIEKIIKNNI